MSALAAPLLALLQRPREPQELLDLLFQAAILLALFALPLARALFERLKKRQGGPGADLGRARRPTPGPGPGRGAGPRPEGIDLFERLLRGEPLEGGEAPSPVPPPVPPRRPVPAPPPPPRAEPATPWSMGPAGEERPFEPAVFDEDRAAAQEQQARARELLARGQREVSPGELRSQGPSEGIERARGRERKRRAQESSEREQAASDARSALSSLGGPAQAPAQRRPRGSGVRRGAFARLGQATAWREAVLLSEVLGPPLCLRDPRRGPGSASPRGD